MNNLKIKTYLFESETPSLPIERNVSKSNEKFLLKIVMKTEYRSKKKVELTNGSLRSKIGLPFKIFENTKYNTNPILRN